MLVIIWRRNLVKQLVTILAWLAITLGGLVSGQYQQLTLDVAQLPLEWPVIVLAVLLVATVSYSLYWIDVFQDFPAKMGGLPTADKKEVRLVTYFKGFLGSLYARLVSYWGKWLAIRLFATLTVGFVAGAVFVFVIFAIWFSLIVQALVAVGTFMVGLAAFYQSYAARKERTIRDMTTKVYAHLRKDVLTWLEVENQECMAWPDLKLSQPWWVHKLRKPLFSLLNRAEELYRKIVTLRRTVGELESQETARLSEKLSNRGRSHTIRILTPSHDPIHIYVGNVWLTAKSLNEYAVDRIAKDASGAKWNLDLMIDGHAVGNDKTAEDFANQLIAFLETQQTARDYRDLVSQLKSLGPQTLLLIDKEIG